MVMISTPRSKGSSKAAEDRLGELDHPRAAGRAPAHHDELVAAGAGDDVAAADCGEQPPTGGEEELVADDVAEVAIDPAETVEVDEQDGNRSRPLAEAVDLGCEQVEEAPAVGQRS